MIDFSLSEDQRLVTETVRRFAATVLRPQARRLERAGAIPDELARAFHALGLTLCDVPEAAGGLGVGATTAVLVHEELAFGDPGAAVALWAPHLVPQALVAMASPAQAARLLAPFSTDPLRRGAVAYGGAASATPDGDDWILEGEKTFVINNRLAETTIVFAGGNVFAVEGKMAAGPRATWLGLETVTAGSLKLDGVRVPEANRLAHPEGAAGFFARAALVTAARQVGLARAAYETALAYTQDRSAFGKPVAHFQAVSFILADMHMEVESARWMVWRAAAALDQERADASLAIDEAAVHANQAAWRVADNGVQLLGGAGFIQDFPVEKWLRDTKALALVGGVDQLAQLRIGGTLIGVTLDDGLPDATVQPVVT